MSTDLLLAQDGDASVERQDGPGGPGTNGGEGGGSDGVGGTGRGWDVVGGDCGDTGGDESDRGKGFGSVVKLCDVPELC